MLLGLFHQQQSNNINIAIVISFCCGRKFKKITASKPTDGCSVLAHPDCLHMLGARSTWNTTGALKMDCEEPHHGINALLPVEAQSNVCSLIPRLNLHVLALSH